MGHRKIMRVPLNFNWPLKKIWEGYINNNYPEECYVCKGEGVNKETLQLYGDYYDFDGSGQATRRYVPYDPPVDVIEHWRKKNMNLDCLTRGWGKNITQDEVEALVIRNRLWDLTRTYSRETGWVDKDPSYMPMADEVNRWNATSMGHDSINQWILCERRAFRLGIWGRCWNCKGKGRKFYSQQHYRDYRSWKKQDPPSGPGYQVWETVSEGSPMTPVFADPKELAQYCELHVSLVANNMASAANWLKMIVGDEDMKVNSLLIMTAPAYQP